MVTATVPKVMHQSLNGLMRSPASEGIRVEVVMITPDLAKSWLKRNTVNRHLRKREITRMVKALQSGLWQSVNGETIVFGQSGTLLDGQHRLSACAEANISFQSLVVFGVEDQKRKTIDTGAKRLLSDVFSMDGESNSTRLAAACSVLHAWETEDLLQSPHGCGFITHEEGEQFLATHSDLKEAVQATQATALFYAFHAKDYTLAYAWTETLKTGHAAPGHESFYTLRERLIRQLAQRDKLHALETFVYSIKAWNAVRQHKTIKVFKWWPEEEIPEVR